MAMPPRALRKQPAPPTAPQEPSALPPPKSVAFGREIAAAREQPEKHTGEPPDKKDRNPSEPTASPPQASVPSHTADRLPPAWSHLPVELLQQIFLCLPLSALGPCALVCRHWYASLPSTRRHVTTCLEEMSLARRHVMRHFATSYRLRALSWLKAHRSRLVPQLEAQYREWSSQGQLPLASLQNRQQEISRDFLSLLVHYSLRQQTRQLCQLRLEPFTIQRLPRPVALAEFSPCGGFLAAACRNVHTGAASSLRLCAWTQGRWNTAVLDPPPDEPVRAFTFSKHRPDRLITASCDRIIVWDKDADTGNWHRSCERRYAVMNPVRIIISMADGDFITVCSDTLIGKSIELNFFQCIDQALHGRQQVYNCQALVVPRHNRDDQRPRYLAWHTELGQLAVVMEADCQKPGPHGHTSIHIWSKGIAEGTPDSWDCQVSDLEPELGSAVIQDINYSPDGRHLMTLNQNNRIFLWALDPRCRLQWKLTVTTQPAIALLSARACFRADGQQLAVCRCPHQIQFWNLDEAADWIGGTTLDIVPQARQAPHQSDRKLIRLLLSGNGQTLARCTMTSLDIWHRGGTDVWQPLVQHQSPCAAPRPPLAFLVGSGDLLAATAGDTQGTLWLYGADHAGELVRKDCITTGAPVSLLTASADGLTLMVWCKNSRPLFLQPAGMNAVQPGPP